VGLVQERNTTENRFAGLLDDDDDDVDDEYTRVFFSKYMIDVGILVWGGWMDGFFR